MIPCYFDTGLVLKLVVKEPLSSAVLDFVRRLRGQELILDFSNLKHQPRVTPKSDRFWPSGMSCGRLSDP